MMFLSNHRTQKAIALFILFGMVFSVGFSVYEGTSKVVSSTVKSADQGSNSSIKETESVTDVNAGSVQLLSLGVEMPELSLKSSDSILQQEAAVQTVTTKEPEIKVTEETEVSVEETKALQSFSTPDIAEQEPKHKYYEVYDPTDGNWYHMDKDLQDYTYDLCVEYEIEKHFALLLSQFYAESRYNPKAISDTSDYGIGQINKCNHASLRKKLGITNFLDAEQGILATIYMMSGYLKKYDTISEALVVYNTGNHYNSNPYSRRVLEFYDSVREIQD